MTKTAILGAGAMGESVLAGLIRAGRPLDSLLVGEKREARARELTEKHGIAVVDNVTAAQQADTLVVAVKPQVVAAVLTEVADSLRPGQIVISLAAGVTIATLEGLVPAGVVVIRVMPNTPALVGAGMSVMSPGSAATDDALAEAESLLSACGRVLTLPEKQIDAVTAISGSGPAYVFLVAEALIESGVHLGLPRDVATELAVQTLLGSATMLSETGTHPTLLREQVTSPGGTTAAALGQLEQHGLRAAFVAATAAARDRSVELAGS
ncbi:pyrroline-5-carboxylate reductase [Nocardioides daphniae]|uniref:Pyrroline-5-carboxylate reductase n=1 Tax=Nocardioides daphniae TaxID=402297 RepID=A0A4P7UFU4_9ACTN|nr:pyrroline-5-carboxylate reductase [Nocardioides daphniae]QCC78265.1 pyrroline-5-carboxylate reductase [Nocardioides daphniae]GGD20336.1 pyrroline-5-carboxylate reductase [Nocardioides daphniae]